MRPWLALKTICITCVMRPLSTTHMLTPANLLILCWIPVRNGTSLLAACLLAMEGGLVPGSGLTVRH